MDAFWASENCDAFIVFRSSNQGKISRKTLTLNGPVFWERIMAMEADLSYRRDPAREAGPTFVRTPKRKRTLKEQK
jgi:hypothetical protein